MLLSSARAGAMEDVFLGTISDDTIRSIVDGSREEVIDLPRSLEPSKSRDQGVDQSHFVPVENPGGRHC